MNGQKMKKTIGLLQVSLCIIAITFSVSSSALAQSASAEAELPAQSELPKWLSRGLPVREHEVLTPLVGTWRVQMSFYGTLGRSPDQPPLVTDDLISRRQWLAGGRYIEDTMEGTLDRAPVWRRGWLGYSIMDARYEWVTIDPVNTTMMHFEGAPNSGGQMPISMSGAFTDQGVAGEDTVGKSVGMRTVIKIENNDRHVFELYFTRPGQQETLATRAVYTRLNE
ncbi:MAG: DUF1579 domain-containing protein [Mesorhizobium sp.]|nr:MAG: DUF1579 domain-containing protein [Mesorhizobium sp.]